MNRQDLKNAYPSLSYEGREQLLNRAAEIASDSGTETASQRSCKTTAKKVSPKAPTDKSPNRKLSLAIVIALTLLLTLVGMAYAAVQLGIVDYLIGSRATPSSELVSSAQLIYAIGEADGIVLTVTGAMYDGERLSLSWTLENKNPEELASVRLKGVTFGDEWTDAKFSGISQTAYDSWSPDVFDMQEATWGRNPQIGGLLTRPLNHSHSGMQQVKVELGISRPQKPLVVLDPNLLANLTTEDDPILLAEARYLRDSLVGSNVTIADAQHQDPGYWWEKGYMVVDGGTPVLPENILDAMDPEWIWEAEESPYRWDRLMEDTATLTVCFQVDADSGQAYRMDNWRFKDGSMECRLPGCTVQVKRLSISPLSTVLHYQMIADENTEEAALWLYETYGEAELRDEQGRELAFSSMESAFESSIGLTEDGHWMKSNTWDYPGLMTFPKEIHLAVIDGPFNEVSLTPEQRAARDIFAEKMVFVQP